MIRRFALLALAAAAASCSDATSPEDNVTQVVVSPATSTAFTNQTLQLTAKAMDAANTVISGVVFAWTTSDSSVATVNTAGLVQPAGKRGPVIITARSGKGATGQATIAFTPPAASLTVVGGAQQSATVGQALPQPIVVELKATDGLPIAGIPVTFTAPAGASVSTPTVLTGSDGRASSGATLATASGTQTFTASAAGLTTTTSETGRPEASAIVTIVGGDAQADTVHKTLAQQMVIRVADRYGNGVPSIAVAWTRVGSGTLVASSSATGSDGTASTAYSLGAAAGTETVTATIAGLAPVTFSARAIAAAPEAIAIVSGNSQSAAVSTDFAAPLIVRVSDARGFGVAGVVVNWSATNATTTAASSTTDDSGQASIGVHAGSTVGVAAVTAAVGAHSVAFSLNAAAGTPANLAFRVQPSQVVAGRLIAPSIQVALVDAAGNLTTSTAVVTLSIAAGTGTSGAQLAGATARNAVNGIAVFPDISIDRSGAGFRLVASSGALPSATSAAFNVAEPPVTVSLASVTQTSCTSAGVCSTVPANLQNAADQLNVTYSIDGNAAASAVILRCGTDSIITAQGAFANRAPASTVVRTTARTAARTASIVSSLTSPLNTAAFNTNTGAVSLRNGTCTLRAAVKPAVASAQVIEQNATASVILNNQDKLLGRMSIPRSGTGVTLYFGGDVTAAVLPVVYSGRTPVAATIGLALLSSGRAAGTLPPPLTSSSPPFLVTFPNTVGAPSSVANVTAQGLSMTAVVTLNSGAALTELQSVSVSSTTPATSIAVNEFNLDNTPPLPGVLPLAHNTLQPVSQIPSTAGAYLGANFIFAASTAAGYCGPNSTGFNSANTGSASPVCVADGNQLANLDARGGLAGSGGVSVRFQYSAAVTGTFTDVSSASGLSETIAYNTLMLRQITTDALGNADTSFADGAPFVTGNNFPAHATRFGVDKTAPVASLSGAADGSKFLVNSPAVGSAGNYSLTAVDAVSGVAADGILVAQVRSSSTFATGSLSASAIDGKTYTNTGAGGTFGVAQSTTDLSPCSIGRFNRLLANAGASNLPVFDSNGTTIGYCTAVPYNPAGGTQIPAAAAPDATGGYYATLVVAVDAAGNRSAAQTRTILEDAVNPVATVIDFPIDAVGNTAITYGVSGSDNLDGISAFGEIEYPISGLTLQYPAGPPRGVAFDNALTRSFTADFSTAPFIQHLQLNDGVSAVPRSTALIDGLPLHLQASVIDAAGRVGSTGFKLIGIYMALHSTGSFAYSTSFTGGFSLAASALSVSNCSGSCSANPSSTTLTATARGTSGTFANPFTTIQFWYQPMTGASWQLAGTTTAATSSDNGVTRAWSYAFTWDPPLNAAVRSNGVTPSLAPTFGLTIPVQVRAIGITSLGDAVASPAVTIMLTNP